MQLNMKNVKIGFIGAGAMATALAKGIVSSGLMQIEQIRAYDIKKEALDKFSNSTGAGIVDNPEELVSWANTILLAIKPAHVGDALGLLKNLPPTTLVISIVAGVSTQKIERNLVDGIRVVRVMPNTPLLVKSGASAYCGGKNATNEDEVLVGKIFSSAGIAFALPESMLDAVTGLSGSGPAFIYLVIEALSDGGVAAGLPRNIATRLAAQTVMGAGKMVLETGLHPGELKDMVTSPAGTTIEGVAKLEKEGIRAAFIDAVRAAAKRSRELGELKN